MALPVSGSLTIGAVGQPETLAGSLSRAGGIVAQLAGWRGVYAIAAVVLGGVDLGEEGEVEGRAVGEVTEAGHLGVALGREEQRQPAVGQLADLIVPDRDYFACAFATGALRLSMLKRAVSRRGDTFAFFSRGVPVRTHGFLADEIDFEWVVRECEVCADAFHVADEPGLFATLANSLDLIISTVPANIDLEAHLGLLAIDGTFVNLSIPSKPLTVGAAVLAANRAFYRAFAERDVDGHRAACPFPHGAPYGRPRAP